MSAAIADVLDGAADLLERDGWTGVGAQKGSCLCPIVAISRAGKATGAEEKAIDDALQVLSLATGTFGYGWGSRILMWNEAPGQTAENVLSTLRRVAADERGKP